MSLNFCPSILGQKTLLITSQIYNILVRLHFKSQTQAIATKPYEGRKTNFNQNYATTFLKDQETRMKQLHTY